MKTAPPPPSTGSTMANLGQEAIERLAAIVASSDDAIIGKDIHGVITSWNPGAEKIFGYSEKEAVGKSIQFLLPPERMEEESFILNKILKGERVFLKSGVRTVLITPAMRSVCCLLLHRLGIVSQSYLSQASVRPYKLFGEILRCSVATYYADSEQVMNNLLRRLNREILLGARVMNLLRPLTAYEV